MQAANTPPSRHYYIDNLRAVAVALLVVFHTGLVFTPFFNFVLVNAEGSMVIAIFAVAFLHLWHMPLFFFLAGMTAFFSLQRRTTGQFMLERVTRILLPFVFGFIFIIPPQVYWDRMSRGRFDGSYLDFLPLYFTEGFTRGYVSWHHLWFILYLFLISLMALPVLLGLKTRAGEKLRAWLGSLFAKPWALLLVPLPSVLTEMALRANHPSGYYNFYTDWANVVLYLVYLVTGFIFAADARLLQSARRFWKTALLLALPITTALLWMVWDAGGWPALVYGDPVYYLYAAAGAVNTWLWVIGITGFGMHHLNGSTRRWRYASSISYPYYILHQTVLIGIAYYATQLDASVWLKYTLIAVPTFFLTAGAVELVKLSPVTRFMVGLPAKKPQRTPESN